ncbi:MAG TPA: hypothetical protein VLG44_04430, partial [Chlamydiales bacterium]|nr:hypothetical protein [Chlamydiales bacterium]
GISHVQNLRLFNALDGTFLTSDKIFTLDVRGMIMNEQLFGLCQRMLFGTLPSLKQLNINNLQGPCSSQFFGLLPKIFPQLKALEMHSADVTMETVKTTFPAMTNLECLSFTCYRSLETFLSTLPNLRSLRVTLQEMPEPMAIRHTALRRLHIKWDSEEPLVSGSEREIVHLFDCCPNLEELIMEMPLVVDSFQYITNYFPKLKKLVVLTQVPACLEEQLPVFAKKHPYLELLEIMGMRMEASTYLKIIDACPSLKQTLVKEFVNWENVLWTNEQFDTFFHDKVFFSYALTKISHLKIESSEGTLLSLRLAADHLPNIKNFSIIVRNEIPVADLEYLLTHTEANVQLDVTAADPQDVKERGLKLFTRFPRLHVVSNPQL